MVTRSSKELCSRQGSSLHHRRSWILYARVRTYTGCLHYYRFWNRCVRVAISRKYCDSRLIRVLLSWLDFSDTEYKNASEAFARMRLYSKCGPLINSEFYTGRLERWNEKRVTIKTAPIIKLMDELFDLKACFNFYMMYGGTSYDFSNGNLLRVVYARETKTCVQYSLFSYFRSQLR